MAGLSDPNSDISKVDQAAIAAGTLIDVSTGDIAISGKTEARDLTAAEILEHEIVAHAGDSIAGVNWGTSLNEQNARDIGNAFRDKSGIPFKRTSPGIWIRGQNP